MQIEKHAEGTKLLKKIQEARTKLDSITCLISYSKSNSYNFEISCDHIYSVEIPTPMVQDILYEMKEKYESELSLLEKKFKKL